MHLAIADHRDMPCFNALFLPCKFRDGTLLNLVKYLAHNDWICSCSLTTAQSSVLNVDTTNFALVVIVSSIHRSNLITLVTFIMYLEPEMRMLSHWKRWNMRCILLLTSIGQEVIEILLSLARPQPTNSKRWRSGNTCARLNGSTLEQNCTGTPSHLLTNIWGKIG